MSLFLDGVDDYAFAADHAAFKPTNAVTVMAWVKRGTGTTGISPWIAGKVQGADLYSYYLGQSATDTNHASIVADTGGTTSLASASGLSTIVGNWTFMMARWESGAANNIRIRRQGDGTDLADVTSATVLTGPLRYDTKPFRIGANAAPSTFYKGRIAHVGLWGRRLTDAEYLSLAGGANPQTVSGLLEYFPLLATGDTTGLIASNSLTLMGGAAFDADNPTVDTYTNADPANLAVAVSGTQLTYTWDASPTPGVTTYSVCRRATGGTGNLSPATDEIARSATSPYVETGVAAGSYDCQVFGVIPGA